MKKEIKNSRFDVLASKRNSLSLSTSLDENSKKIQKLRIKIKDSKLNKTMPASLQMDMKSVRVLVERTKFNVMLNSEHKLNKIRLNNSLKSSAASSSSTSSSSTTTSTTTSQSTSTITKTTSNLNSKSNSTSIKEKEIKESNTPLRKLSNKNGPLASSTPQRPPQDSASPQKKTPSKTKPSSLEAAGERSRASETVGVVEHQQTIDEIYKVRKCCIKIPKDKLLLQLQQGKQHMPYPVKLIVHKARGRAKKDKADQSDADNLLMVESPSTASTTTSSTTANVVTGTATDRDVNAGAKGASEAPSKPSIGQKRKSSEKQSSVSPPKRKTKKGNEFFIKIGALTRVPSPRRRLASNSSSPEDKPPLTSKQRRKTAKKLNTKSLVSARLSPLRQKFGIRFFKSFVKIKRMVAAATATATAAASAAAFASAASNREQPSLSYSPPKTADTTTTPKKKNGKNLTVSFLETVEIFGESSDEDDWFESDAKNASRNTKPLDSLFDSLKSSTPCIRNSSTSSSINNSIVSINNSSSTSSSNSSGCGSGSGSSSGSGSGILKSSILDRKEKKSFSPLKETETESESPRKQQLKKANESFVRSSLETQVDEEERDNAEDRTEEAESAEKSSTLPESNIIKDDIEHQNSSKDLSKINDSDTSSPSKLSANKPAAQISDEKTVNKEEKDEQLTSSNASNEDTPIEEQNASNSNKDVENEAEVAEEEAETTPIQNEMNENEDSFKSATNTECNDSVGTEVLDEPNHSPSPSQTAENDEEMEENLAEDSTAQLETEAEAQLETQDEEPSSADQIEDPQEHEHELKQEEEEVEEGNHIDEISKDACPDDEEEPFVDPTKLVASVLLNDSTEEGRNEAQAVLNDVCQMAADESSVLLSTTAAHLAYSSPHSAMDDDDDDDFTNSVLTHPETEKTLQSAAASDLVPNSQEIAVEASVVSQAALVAPADVDVTEDTFASVVAEVERFTKDVNSEIYAEDVGITGTDVMMDNVQARHSLDDIFDDDVDDDIMSSLRMSGGSIDIGHDKSLPIQVIETEVMAIPNEPDLIFDKPLGTTASSLNLANDTLPVAVVRGGGGGAGVGVGPTSAPENHTKLFGRLFQSVKSYVMSPGGDKNSTLQD
ncbi:serine-rich adhesin for platelets-like isoform X2 [Eupeodes corollae]|uniref:serine-rich adhesin for platelets-like isoform X2 n=1 Tax=Eupeodes corollae TaxID=290404 RepID=UPI0024900C96|nr:serine-rich adhesin for platelets-like isoform X2 [Eupeodes corollae]